MMSKIILSAVFFLIFTKSIFADHLYDKESYQLGSIEERCEKALEFYLTRPDLETEFHRRLNFVLIQLKTLVLKDLLQIQLFLIFLVSSELMVEPECKYIKVLIL